MSFEIAAVGVPLSSRLFLFSDCRNTSVPATCDGDSFQFVCTSVIHFLPYYCDFGPDWGATEEILKSRLERLLGSKSSSFQMEKSTKEEIIEVLDGAVLHMCLAANTALDTATAKLEKVDEAYHESINSLVQQIKGLLTEVSRTQDDYASLKGVTVSDNECWTMYG
ncbi:hypothetical protein ECG_09119 [Echinococcus granulosus]|uniref:Expressed conserved protein n=1 Tax=Echinococcus granulosus TaxID=6210 RepID=A0A068WUM0_ECHGR|nr:hypothetical protein ECG_09119 [Echinococcus granulosus]CDS21284.1 hypothetical protein EgrG_000168000 [Echinococcus granulosus]